ncbi:nitronate monooxygenase [Streptomyces fagopyri]|uniref:Propionate 3-nitronate monooxygenase n=1 Tax=Streptomyces fagopyri TaxID=2662397 RepID=A0A5Q0LMM4_9ACTN|nr:nitronate monooxygenase [Streptomyces fagopyri]QFZ77744.1 nitronate monooxygenase [Streptomyces fagopyri]
MNSLLDALGVTTPVLAAPMAGGATTTALVAAAARAGGLGFVPAGYASARTLAERVAAARAERVPFGVNVFAPNPLPVDRAAFDRYATLVQATADRHHVDLSGQVPVEDDDAFAEKVGLLAEDPVPVVSFTFGIPGRAVVARLRAAGSLVAQTVTGVAEARAAAEAGVDVLVVQAAAAGGHSGTLTPRLSPPDVPVTDLIAMVRHAVGLPLIAAGGLGTPEDVALVMAAGAQAAMVGTVLLRTEESGASAVHQAALADPAGRGTVLTRAFTGRPARALRNRFTDLYGDHAPYGYPALHHLTGPLRKQAAAAGDAGTLHLWAGTGHRRARREGAGQTLTRLAAAL